MQGLIAGLMFVMAGGMLSAQPLPGDESVSPDTTVVEDGKTPGSGNPNMAEITRLRDAMLAHRELGRPDLALQEARDLVDALEDQLGGDRELFKPLSEIADLQMQLGDPTAAELTLRRLVSIIDSTDSVFSDELVDPLTMLAGLAANSHRRDEAITMLRRARHITHRQLGILNLEQLEIAQQLADNYFKLNKISDGSRESRFAYRVNVNEYGAESAEIVPATNTLAAWYERIGEFTIARRYYKQSLDLIAKDYGEDDLRMVETLQLLAQTYKNQGIYKREGQNALIKAADILATDPDADQVARANSLTELGDWQLATMRTQDAITTYVQAWNILTADGANPEKGNSFFKEPRRVRYQPPIPTATRLSSLPEVNVDVQLLVTPEGSTRDVTILESTADWRTQAEVRSAMRYARYRPKFVDGKPVPAKISTRWTYVVPPHLRRHSTANSETTNGANTQWQPDDAPVSTDPEASQN